MAMRNNFLTTNQIRSLESSERDLEVAIVEANKERFIRRREIINLNHDIIMERQERKKDYMYCDL